MYGTGKGIINKIYDDSKIGQLVPTWQIMAQHLIPLIYINFFKFILHFKYIESFCF